MGNSVQQTKDGGFIITGYTGSYLVRGGDVWLIKTDSSGNEEWSKTFGGAYSDFGNSVQQTKDGGFIITGLTFLYSSYSARWHYDVWLIKTDSRGNVEWSKTFGGLFFNDAGYSVQQTTDGGFIVAGYTYRAAGTDVWLIKTDSRGNVEWSKTFGGAYDDGGYSVQQTTDGGFSITGYTGSYLVSGGDVWLIKTDSSGNEEWSKTFGGASRDWGHSVQQTKDGGFIITGFTGSYGAGGEDVWLIKVTAEESTTKKGDLNDDNEITPSDAAIALKMAVRGEWDTDADVSDDGQITSLDALMILQAAAGAISL